MPKLAHQTVMLYLSHAVVERWDTWLRVAHHCSDLDQANVPTLTTTMQRSLNMLETCSALQLLRQYTQHQMSQNLSKFNIFKVEQIITSIRAKFVRNLRIQKLPSEFRDFVTMVDFHDENVRLSRFSPFNYNLVKDKTNPRYHISNSWNNIPFLVIASQSDDFLEDLRCSFNSVNDQPCTVDKCWFCDEQ